MASRRNGGNEVDHSPGDFKSRVLQWISGLSEHQFANLFYEAAKAQRATHPDEEEAKFVLADASDEEQVAFIGLADDEHYPEGFADDAPLCQFGTCPECEADVLSVAKNALCPICGEKVYCT